MGKHCGMFFEQPTIKPPFVVKAQEDLVTVQHLIKEQQLTITEYKLLEANISPEVTKKPKK